MTDYLTLDNIATLLGRPLSSSETSNFDDLLSSAKSTIESVLGASLDSEEKTLVYRIRIGYKQQFICPFSSLTSAKLDGLPVDAVPLNYDDYNAQWFNSILLDSVPKHGMLQVTAKYGYGDELPLDIQKLVATMFAITSESVDVNNSGAITSESILNHSVNYAAASSDGIARFILNNSSIIDRYKSFDVETVYGDENAISRRHYDI